jgi:copper chaperone
MKLTLDVPKIKCGGCAQTIQESLSTLAGVSQVEVDIDAKRVALDLDPAGSSEDQVRQRLSESGFPAA